MLCASGAVVGSVLAGCTADGDDTGEPQTGQPIPLVADQRSTRPEVLDVSSEQVSQDEFQFTARVYNGGPAGTVGVALVWLEEEGDDVYGPASEVADVRETEFDEQESLEVTFTTAFPDEYGAFGFRVWTGTIEADIQNTGGGGQVRVELLENDTVVDETELVIDGGETATVEFDGDFSELDFENVTIETSVP